MKRLAALAFLLATDAAHVALKLATIAGLTIVLVLSGCPKPGGKPDPTIQQIGQVAKVCLEPAIVKLVTQILPEVVLDLVSGQYAKILTDLVSTLTQAGVQDAFSVVTCAVANVQVNGAHAPAGSALSPVVEHANEWMRGHALPYRASNEALDRAAMLASGDSTKGTR